jgi:uncharacterized protein involved in exopolysaccharide biosynthesis
MMRRWMVFGGLVVPGMVMGCASTPPTQTVVVPRRLAADSVEIVSLRRQIDSLQIQHNADSVQYVVLQVRLDSVVAQVPVGTPDSVVKAKDAQIAALQDQVAKLSQELERIKKRLANPRP